MTDGAAAAAEAANDGCRPPPPAADSILTVSLDAWLPAPHTLQCTAASAQNIHSVQRHSRRPARLSAQCPRCSDPYRTIWDAAVSARRAAPFYTRRRAAGRSAAFSGERHSASRRDSPASPVAQESHSNLELIRRIKERRPGES